MSDLDNAILLIGAGGHAASCIDVIESEGRYQIAGLVGRPSELGAQISGYEVVIADEALSAGLEITRNAIVAVGQIMTPDVRMTLFEQLADAGFARPVIISPNAYVSRRAHLGSGTIIMHGSLVNAAATVHENCIINNRAMVEHGASVGGHSHVSTGAIVNGDVSVGEGCFIGSGAVLREGIQIGKRCVIGMGVVVKHDLSDGTVLKR